MINSNDDNNANNKINTQTTNLICPICDCEFFWDDAFCGECGYDLIDFKNNYINEKDKDENEKVNYAKDLLIDAEGNKFKAIKLFKEKYDVDNDEASKYINNAFNDLDNNDDETENSLSTEDLEKEIVLRNGNNKITAVKELKDTFGYDIVKAKDIADKYDNSIYNTNKNNNPNEILKTIIVGSTSHKKATSAIGRGLVGGALLGPIGLLAGTTAKTKDVTTFQVIYKSGRQETVKVKTNSKQFNYYCQFLDN